jgi:hypothetical protein
MEKKRLVVSTWEMSDSGPAKRAYQITPWGNDCLRRWVETLKQYREAIAVLLNAAAKAARRTPPFGARSRRPRLAQPQAGCPSRQPPRAVVRPAGLAPGCRQVSHWLRVRRSRRGRAWRSARPDAVRWRSNSDPPHPPV